MLVIIAPTKYIVIFYQNDKFDTISNWHCIVLNIIIVLV